MTMELDKMNLDWVAGNRKAISDFAEMEVFTHYHYAVSCNPKKTEREFSLLRRVRDLNCSMGLNVMERGTLAFQ